MLNKPDFTANNDAYTYEMYPISFELCTCFICVHENIL